jgi:ubiquinone/menaquinone biosynthesis C-methylase UbiE
MPGYDEHVREEIAHYDKIYEEAEPEALVQPVPLVWGEAERAARELIIAATGDDLAGNVISRLNARPGMRLLSLGCGPGGLELHYAEAAPSAEIVAVDINPGLLEKGRERARERDLRVTFEAGDLNTIDLPEAEFDVVFCHAALHHVLELERLAEQMKRALRPGGSLITIDVISRNGYLMWPESREVVRGIFRTLPERFRLNHTGYSEPKVDDEIWVADTSAHGMECARSEDILPVLNAVFTTKHFVPYFSISRRFVDTMYGPNYDVQNRALDRALFNWIWELDRFYIESGTLKPETFFGVYGVPSA